MIDAIRSCFGMFVIAWHTSRSRITIAVVLNLLAGLAWPMLALALKAAVNASIAHDTHRAVLAGIFIGVGAIGVLVLHHFSYLPYVETGELALITLDEELIRLANDSARLEHHERVEYADKLELLQRELRSFPEGMTGLLTLVGLAVSLTLTGVLLASVNPWLLLLPLAAIPPMFTGQWAQRLVERAKVASATPTRQSWHFFHLATQAESAKELRVFGLQEEVRRRHQERWAVAGHTLLVGELKGAAVVAAGQLVFALAYVIAVLVVLHQAIAGDASVGDVVLIITLAAQVNQQVSALLELLRQLQRIAQGLTRLRWMRELIAAQEPGLADEPAPVRIRSGIELRDVDFAYPGTDRPVLAGVNLSLPAGSTVAIVGENGAGKTTLVKLLCRFYDATAGVITVDGVDLDRIDVREWRGRISAGFQDFVRFELQAQDVVGLGDLPARADVAAVTEALERARVSDILDRLDDGLATQLGKSWTDGTELSGGQWQKLALGRAMMRERPLLLVLDEPTSALDAEAEHQLFEQYAENARRVGADTGAITVLVSHRFSTVRMADIILVVADGRIAEVGSHVDLMTADGLYAELFSLQAEAYR